MKAALFLLGWQMAAFPALWASMSIRVQPLSIVLPMAALLGLLLLNAVDAWAEARRQRGLPRAWYSRWYSCAAVWLLNVLVIAPGIAAILISVLVQAFAIPTGAMEPIILVGDYLLVNKTAYGVRLPILNASLFGGRTPERGDLIVFPYPEDPRRPFIKRVIGLPGEAVEMRDDTLSIDGRTLDEPYARYLDCADGYLLRDWGPYVVPSGKLFVLGDNRDNSKDSRYWGFVPIDTVLGRAQMVYYSWDAREKRVRWSRVGLPLR